jgi:copper(I)-binding protein
LAPDYFVTKKGSAAPELRLKGAMKNSCAALTAIILGWSGMWLPGPAAAQTHDHTQGQHGAAAMDAPPCDVPPQITEAAEMRLGGAMYTAPEATQHSGHAQATAEAQGAHSIHDPQRGGTFYMAPNKTHHIEGVYTEECGFQLFLYNAFTESIRVDRFQAFVHVFPASDDEFDIIRFLSPALGGTVLAARFGDAVSRPFDVELYIRFPDQDAPQMFNIAVAEAEAHDPGSSAGSSAGTSMAASGIVLSQAWSRPVMRDRPGAAYLTIANNGATADRLLGATSPGFKSVELHLTRKSGDMTMMSPVKVIDLPANGTVDLAPGGYHMMLFHAQKQLKQDDSFPLVLTFEKAGRIEVQVQVTHGDGQQLHTGHGSN